MDLRTQYEHLNDDAENNQPRQDHAGVARPGIPNCFNLDRRGGLTELRSTVFKESRLA